MKVFKSNQNIFNQKSRFNSEVKSDKVIETNGNPFINALIKDTTQAFTTNLLDQLREANSKRLVNNAFLAAALICEPSAVKGITTQIRIA